MSALSPTSPTSNLPTRSATQSTEDDAVPGEDTSEVTKLFAERLQAWKHAVVYLEDYITATEKAHHSAGKDYDKVIKSVSSPLKEGHHFQQEIGGVAGLFDNIRSNTQGVAKSHEDTAKTLKGSVLPVFERLHTEIKNKQKELTKGAGKGSKAVDKARTETQKHIDSLAQHTATYDSKAGRSKPSEDPYILQRGVLYRLNKQVIEENNNRQDLIAVQNSFAQFETSVLATMQSGVGQFNQVIAGRAEHEKAIFADIQSTASKIAPDFEWNGFLNRNNGLLIDPNAPPRTVGSINFANQNHKSTQPLIAGSLEKKGKLLKKYDTAYYVVTPSKFLHEFKTDDDYSKEPTPDVSLYLPDCMISPAVNGQKFNVKGKDVSGNAVGKAFSMSHEYQFKAHTPQDAAQWLEVIRQQAGSAAVSQEMAAENDVASPTDAAAVDGVAGAATTGTAGQPAAIQTQGLPQQQQTSVPASAVPQSAGTIPQQTGTLPQQAGTIPQQPGSVPQSATSTLPPQTSTLPQTSTVPQTAGVPGQAVTSDVPVTGTGTGVAPGTQASGVAGQPGQY